MVTRDGVLCVDSYPLLSHFGDMAARGEALRRALVAREGHGDCPGERPTRKAQREDAKRLVEEGLHGTGKKPTG